MMENQTTRYPTCGYCDLKIDMKSSVYYRSLHYHSHCFDQLETEVEPPRGASELEDVVDEGS